MSLVAEGGGAPSVVLKADASRQERAVRFPSFLPDGRHFLYLASSPTEKRPYLRLASIAGGQDGSAADELFARTVRAGRPERSRPRPIRVSALRDRGEPAGTAVRQPAVTARRRSHSRGAGDLATGAHWRRPLLRVKQRCPRRSGRGKPGAAGLDRPGRPGDGFHRLGSRIRIARLSPDSRRVVVSRANPRTGLKDLLIGDLSRGVLTRLDLDSDADHVQPIWSPDGTRIAFVVRSPRDPRILHWLALRGSASPEPILPPGGVQRAEDWSPDGRFLLYFGARTEGGSGLWVVNPEGERKPRKLLSRTTDPTHAQFSPDGRWIAYCSPESGRSEVFLTSFPEPGERIRVSVSGGSRPRWKRDGREIYFLSADNEMIATPVRLAAGVEVGQARSLFRIDPAGWRDYDVTPDGERFLAVVSVPVQDADAIAVTANWLSLLPR